MAYYSFVGLDQLDAALRRLGQPPDDVKAKALTEMAQVAAGKIKSQGSALGVRDPESDVHILDNIKRNKAEQTESGGTEAITFRGSRTRGNTKTRNTEIAFVNEYGKRGQRARPFIGTAMTAKEDEISAPAEEVIGDWIENNF